MAANFDEPEAFKLSTNAERLHQISDSEPKEGKCWLLVQFEDAQHMVEPELECSSMESEDGGGSALSADASSDVQCTQIPRALHSPSPSHPRSQSHVLGTQGTPYPCTIPTHDNYDV